MKKLFLILSISLSIIFGANAGVDLSKVGSGITGQSITLVSSGHIAQDISDTGFSLLNTVKVIFQGILLIYIVYIGVGMIISMGTNEDELSKSKRSIRYSIVGLVFINIPGTLYNAFNKNNSNIDISSPTTNSNSQNVLINKYAFEDILNNNITGFIEVAIGAFAILMILIAGLKILTSRGKEEEVTKGKTKILWSIIGLVFIGFIEAWKNVVFTGDIGKGGELFGSMSRFALFFVGPVGIGFLTLAAYYYITANGDEEKAKKAKSIVVNTLIATVLLLASYTFLGDLKDLFNKSF